MNIIADTNMLVRFLLRDDLVQFNAVCRLFNTCTRIYIPTHVLCELVWVLSATYRLASAPIIAQLERLVNSRRVVTCEDEVEAGLHMMRQGGDFADGVNAYTGRKMAASKQVVFATFDKAAVRFLAEQGVATIIPE